MGVTRLYRMIVDESSFVSLLSKAGYYSERVMLKSVSEICISCIFSGR